MICERHGMCRHKYEKQNKKGNYRWRCHRCSVERQSKCLQVRKRRLKSEFGGCCVICGYSKYQGALEFHHLDRETKEFKISCGSYGYQRTLNEAKKCVLLCSNCHREVEAGVTKLPDLFIED